MGAAKTKANALREVLNEVVINVMNKHGTSMDSSAVQENTIKIIGDDLKVLGIKQENLFVGDFVNISKSAASGKLQSELSAKISDAISQSASTIGYSSSEVNTKNIVSNNVQNNITNETITRLSSTVEQKNAAEIRGTSIDVKKISQRNKATVMLKFVSDMNASIIQNLVTKGAIKGDISQKVSNPISDFVNSPLGIILIIFAIIVALGVGWYFFGDKIKKIFTG